MRIMKNSPQYLRKKQLKGSLVLGTGAMLFAVSLFLKNSLIAESYLKLLQGIGVFLIIGGAIMLIQAYVFKKNPTSGRKEMVDELDERKTWIRYRSGNNAFLCGITSTYITMLVVGRTQTSINPDVAWWVLAGIVILTSLVYIISLVVYENRY